MIAIPNMDMPEHCYECLLRQGNCCLLLYEATPPTVPLTRLDDCPLIEIDLERDIPTIWYNRQTGQYEPKGTKQEIYERLYKLKNRERRSDEPDNQRD